MTISSRTPEGTPHRCRVCGRVAAVEPSYPGGDSCCPSCGHLLWLFRDRVDAGVTLASRFDEHWIESIDLVDLVMELEDASGVAIPDEVTDRVKTVEDLLRYIAEQRGEG